jgi:hypothetical protein
MADRSSARAFGQVFDILAQTPTKEIKEAAAKIAVLTLDCDFTTDQMGCDESLMLLDIGEEYQEIYGSGSDAETHTYTKLKCEK